MSACVCLSVCVCLFFFLLALFCLLKALRPDWSSRRSVSSTARMPPDGNVQHCVMEKQKYMGMFFPSAEGFLIILLLFAKEGKKSASVRGFVDVCSFPFYPPVFSRFFFPIEPHFNQSASAHILKDSKSRKMKKKNYFIPLTRRQQSAEPDVHISEVAAAAAARRRCFMGPKICKFSQAGNGSFFASWNAEQLL